MIVLFTSNMDGGILQFTIQIAEVLKAKNQEVTCYIPSGAKYSKGELTENNIKHYDKKNTIWLKDKRIVSLAKEICDMQPEIVWFMDEAIICSQIALNLFNTQIFYSVHDPNPHPTNKNNMRQFLHDGYAMYVRKNCIKVVDRIILLSEMSKRDFINKHGFDKKTWVLPLGAHIPKVKEVMPVELSANLSYYLFFGRIDKYKGLSTLFKAYREMAETSVKLVVAGKGNFTDEEKKLIQDNKAVILINRYIEDNEMMYLFNNAKAVVMPYIEATQSGIIPIAYKVGVPVIVSAVDGLTQFVEHKSTGYICNSIAEYQQAMNNVNTVEIREKLVQNCKNYYKDNLDWETNIDKLL